MKEVTSSASRTCGAGRRPSLRGFTTIELLIALVILGVLLALALPNYQSSMRKSRRAEAFSALTSLQQAQERHRSTIATFATSITAAPPAGLGLPASATVTPAGYYVLLIDPAADATSYFATATAVPGTSQANDGACSKLGVQMAGGNIRYGSGTPIDWTDPQRCWAR